MSRSASRLRDALLNGLANFVLGVVVGRLLGDRRTAVRVGLVLGVLGIVGSLVVGALVDRTDAARLAEELEPANEPDDVAPEPVG